MTQHAQHDVKHSHTCALYAAMPSSQCKYGSAGCLQRQQQQLYLHHTPVSPQPNHGPPLCAANASVRTRCAPHLTAATQHALWHSVVKPCCRLLKKSAIVVQHRPHRDKPYSRTYRIRKGPITFLATFYAPWQVPECVKKQLLASDELLWFDQAGSVVMSYSEVELL